MTIAEAEQYVRDNPQMDWLCGAPLIGDPFRLGRMKPPEAFRDLLRNMKRKHRKSDISVL